jgi:membrane protein implicated in regulation of membrane protease activity
MRFEVCASAVFLIVAMLPLPAAAYVGPGAGISLIGSTIGLLVALGMAIGFVVIWPLRALFRRRGQPSEASVAQGRSEAAES